MHLESRLYGLCGRTCKTSSVPTPRVAARPLKLALMSSVSQPGTIESVWDYPRPPRLEPTARHLQVKLNGQTIADTREGYRVLETSHPPTYYLPPSAISPGCMTESPGGRTFCEWKGRAAYHDVTIGGQTVVRRVWSYPDPTQPFAQIAGYYSFYAHPFECYVDGERVQPQPGDFYGGWMTSDITGGERGVKGGPGTLGW